MQIKNIKKIGIRRTYDISVENNHNFFLSNGILSHNSGKSAKMLTLSQSMYDRKIAKKIWDISGGDRHEGAFWCFPNRDYNLWNKIQEETYEIKGDGPKQYKVTLLYPMFSKKLPNKLPEDLPNVETKVFTIPFRKLTKKHLGLVIGEVGTRAEVLWERILNETNRKSNGGDINEVINNFKDSEVESIMKSQFYLLFIKPLIENHFLNSETSEMNINIQREAENIERVAILCLDYVPEQFHLLVMGYILDEIFDLAKKNKIHRQNFAIFREVSRFMKVVDEDSNRAKTSNAFRNLLVDKVRYGRSGLYFGLDTQDSCLYENTYMFVEEDGVRKVKQIKNVRMAPLVCSYNWKDNKFEFIKSKKLYKGCRECFEITLKNGAKVTATKNHKFFIDKEKRVKLEKLKVGDSILVFSKEDFRWNGKTVITKIENKGMKKVFDIVMDKNHNFLLRNGILSSNSEVKGLIDGNQEILGICELPSPNSIETTCVPLRKAKRMNNLQIQYIQWRIEKHQICIVERGKRAIILKRINPPRTMYWKPEYGNFISFWKKEKPGKFIETKEIINKIKDEYSNRKDIVNIKNIKIDEVKLLKDLKNTSLKKEEIPKKIQSAEIIKEPKEEKEEIIEIPKIIEEKKEVKQYGAPIANFG